MVKEKEKKKFGSFFKRKKAAEEPPVAVKKPVAVAKKTAPVIVVKAPVVEPVQPPTPTVETAVPIATIPKEKGSWLSRTNYFRKLSEWAFEMVDTDGSGEVDEKELYSGLLLIHLKLGSYAGPAACKPVGRERVHEIFKKRDLDCSGSLDRDEFAEVMSVLCGNIFTRVFAQWSLTLMIVPLVAQYILFGLVWAVTFLWDTISTLDDFEAMEKVFIARSDQFGDWLSAIIPNVILNGFLTVGNTLQAGIDMVPDSVWSTVPVTLLSCILGCIVVPYTIFKVDDYFQAMADKKTARQKKLEITLEETRT